MTLVAGRVGATAMGGIRGAAALSAQDVLRAARVEPGTGLSGPEVTRRQEEFGANAVAVHRARPWQVLGHQLRSPLLGLLFAAALVSAFVGERGGALTIAVILGVSVGLGFANEYRAERAAVALHSRIRHLSIVVREGQPSEVDVTALVPGDLVELRLGAMVPADLRLFEVTGLECDESVLTGESLPVTKDTSSVPAGTALADLTGCALTGTVVHAGSARGVVVSTGASTEFGRIATGLSTHHLDTQFQLGLRRFSLLLVYVAGALTTSIFVINVALHRPVIDALLFSLAIAVGITPQLLPAVVSTSLAAGSRRMSHRQVLVKRLVCIEDLGDVEVLFTDKTGTLTQGRIGVDIEHGNGLPWLAGGVVGILVLVAGVVLAVSGKYPEPIYDAVVGMDRWAVRVVAYAGLMTDVYPPFRLDTGGSEPSDKGVPGGGPVPGAPDELPTPAGARTSPAWTSGRIASVVVGAVLTVGALGLLTGGTALLWADRTQRDDAGFISTGAQSYRSSGYAVTGDRLDLHGAGPGWADLSTLVGDVRVRVTAAAADRDIFVGVARSADVEQYLAGVAYASVVDLAGGNSATTENLGGLAPPVPDAVDIWDARAIGTGAADLLWEPKDGRWTFVAMNADGSADVEVTVRAAATLPALPGLAGGALGLGLLALVGGVLCTVVPVARASRTTRDASPRELELLAR